MSLATLGPAATVFGTLALASAPQIYEKDLRGDHPSIGYWRAPLEDPVARLAEDLANGERELLSPGDARSLLQGLFALLGVSADSQVLVFSKTSVQESRISPRSPRAVYFGDDVAIGFVPGSEVLELAALDPRQGVVFYTADARQKGRVRFERPPGCLDCHHGPATLGVPGIYVSSVHTSSSGRPDFRLGTIVTDHRTPLEDRWGGWYVNGFHGGQRHRGNAVALDPAFTTFSGVEETQNLPGLVKKLDASRYPAPVSDIVALMTLDHQTQMTNYLTRLGWEARIAAGSSPATLTARVEEVVAYMLFADEAPLTDPIRGVSRFAETFPQRGPRDSRGRSLRDFDLETRLFRHPLSYMVYSEAFDALPGEARERVLERIHAVLTGRDGSERFRSLSASDREATLEILRDTKPDLPATWRAP